VIFISTINVHVAYTGKMRNAYKILVQNTEEKRLLGRCRQEGNIRTYLREIGLEIVEWIHMAQDKD